MYNNDDNWLDYSKWFFQPADEGDVLSNYMLDSVRLLFDDDEFFYKNIDSIDQNSFSLSLWKRVIGTMIDLYRTNCAKPEIEDVFTILINKSADDIERQQFTELYEFISKRELSDSRKTYIKNSFSFWNAYTLSIKMMNCLKDAIYDGFSTQSKFMLTLNEIIKQSKRLEVLLLKEQNNDFEV